MGLKEKFELKESYTSNFSPSHVRCPNAALNEKNSFGSGVGAFPIHHGESLFDRYPKTEAEPGTAAALCNRGPEGALVIRSGLNKKTRNAIATRIIIDI